MWKDQLVMGCNVKESATQLMGAWHTDYVPPSYQRLLLIINVDIAGIGQR